MTFPANCSWAEPAWHSSLASPYYTASHRQFQRHARAYVDAHLLPHALAWEAAGAAPREARERFARSGLAFLDVPGAYRPRALQTVAGGLPHAGLDAFHELILLDELARLPSGVAVALAGASHVGAPPVLHAGTEAQKRRWLPGLFDWSTSFCLAVTEATAGSDVAAIRTEAVRTPDGAAYVVNGRKKWVTGAPWATHMTTAVRTSSSSSSSSSGISLLVIPLDSPGVSVRKIHHSGHNAGGASWVELAGVRVPAANRLGPEGGGLALVLRHFNKERFALAVDGNRQARLCLAEALRHAHRRETFGRPLAARQLLRAKLVALARDVEAHWARLEQIAYHVAQSPDGWQARDLAGRGYERGRTMTEQISRDLRLKVIGGGSEEILTDLAWREEHKMARAKGKGKALQEAAAKL